MRLRAAFVCLFSLAAVAQDARLTRTDKILIATEAAAHAMDSYLTAQHMTGNRFVEHDPLSAPFIRNRPSLAITSASQFAGELLLQHWMRKHGHQRFAEIVALAGIAGHTEGAVYCATHR